MNLKPYLPTMPQLSRETIAIMIGTIGAAWLISRFPSVREFVNQHSVVIRDTDGETLRL
jgi:hypothetical protein